MRLAKDALNEGGLRVGVCLAFLAESGSQVALESLVVLRDVWVAAQIVAEEEMIVPEGAVALDHMDVVGSRLRRPLTKKAPLGDEDLKLRAVVPAEVAQRFERRLGVREARHADHDVDDRLRRQAWDRCAANMLHGDHPFGNGLENARLFSLILLGPKRVVVHDLNGRFHALAPGDVQLRPAKKRPKGASQQAELMQIDPSDPVNPLWRERSGLSRMKWIATQRG